MVNPKPTCPLSRIVVPELDEILGHPFDVLDDGFVRVVDYMGSDAAVVQAARVSYGAGTRAVSDDRTLIRYLMRRHHTSPFEMCELKLHLRVPMDTWRQWIRHRTASVNEYSTRYSEAIDAAQRTTPDEWRRQSPHNKQASEGNLEHAIGTHLSAQEDALQHAAREVYRTRLDSGVAREQARKDLPLSTYTEAYWKIDLHNLLHFMQLRMHNSAQLEIRSYATVIANRIVSRWVPITWEAFVDFSLSSIHLSRIEWEIATAVAGGGPGNEKALALAKEAGWLDTGRAGALKRIRERQECEDILRGLGLAAPWLTQP